MDKQIENSINECLVHLQHIYRGMGVLPHEHRSYIACINLLLDHVDRLRDDCGLSPFGKRIGIIE